MIFVTESNAADIDKLRTENFICNFDAEMDFQTLNSLFSMPLKFDQASAISNRFSESDFALNSTQVLRVNILEHELLFVLEPDQLENFLD